jgi:hypothetical protein
MTYLANNETVSQLNESTTDENLAKANGLGQAMASAARAIGPATGGALWSLSLAAGNVYLNFILVLLLLASCQWMNSTLSREIAARDGQAQSCVQQAYRSEHEVLGSDTDTGVELSSGSKQDGGGGAIFSLQTQEDSDRDSDVSDGGHQGSGDPVS